MSPGTRDQVPNPPGSEGWAEQLTALAGQALPAGPDSLRPLPPDERVRTIQHLLGDLDRNAKRDGTDPFVVVIAGTKRIRVPLSALIAWAGSEAMPADLGIIRGVESQPDPAEGVAAIRFAPLAHGWMGEDHSGLLTRFLRSVGWRFELAPF